MNKVVLKDLAHTDLQPAHIDCDDVNSLLPAEQHVRPRARCKTKRGFNVADDDIRLIVVLRLRTKNTLDPLFDHQVKLAARLHFPPKHEPGSISLLNSQFPRRRDLHQGLHALQIDLLRRLDHDPALLPVKAELVPEDLQLGETGEPVRERLLHRHMRSGLRGDKLRIQRDSDVLFLLKLRELPYLHRNDSGRDRRHDCETRMGSFLNQDLEVF